MALFLEEVAAVARAPVFLRRMLEATDLQTCEEAMFDHKTTSPANQLPRLPMQVETRAVRAGKREFMKLPVFPSLLGVGPKRDQ